MIFGSHDKFDWDGITCARISNYNCCLSKPDNLDYVMSMVTVDGPDMLLESIYILILKYHEKDGG